jgi:hypothetical protein
MNELTEQQEQALKRAWDILSEHFDGFVLGVRFSCNNDQSEGHDFFYYGGRASALGTATLLKDVIKNNTQSQPPSF